MYECVLGEGEWRYIFFFSCGRELGVGHTCDAKEDDLLFIKKKVCVCTCFSLGVYEKMSGGEGWYKKPNTIELWLNFVMMIVHDSIMILHYVIIILHNVMMIVHDITMILHYVMMMLS